MNEIIVNAVEDKQISEQSVYLQIPISTTIKNTTLISV